MGVTSRVKAYCQQRYNMQQFLYTWSNEHSKAKRCEIQVSEVLQGTAMCSGGFHTIPCYMVNSTSHCLTGILEGYLLI